MTPESKSMSYSTRISPTAECTAPPSHSLELRRSEHTTPLLLRIAPMDLVFIHGAADSSALWELQVRAFERENRVLAVDLPGHGDRLKEPAFDSCDRSAADVLDQIQARGLRAPVLIGHSMGGAIALTIALAHPAVPSALVLAGSGVRLRIRAEIIDAARERAEVSAPGVRLERVIPLED